MSIHVTDFKWEKGKNDLQYIELLEKTLKNEQSITAKAVAKIRELSDENKKIRNKAIDEFAERLKERIVGMQMAELQGEDICPCAENGKECPYINQDIGCQYCAREHTIKEIDEIADEMRGAE